MCQALCKGTRVPKEMRMPCMRVHSLVGDMAWRIHGIIQKHFQANILRLLGPPKVRCKEYHLLIGIAKDPE